MPNIVEFAPFYLKKAASVPDFLIASDKFHNEFMSKQKGYISRKLLVDGEMWSDLVVWSSMEDAQNAINAFDDNTAACEYMSFIDQERSCDIHHFSIEKSY